MAPAMNTEALSDGELARAVAGLSSEQRLLIDHAIAGRDVIVDATVGSGKTFAIQTLCQVLGDDRRILYLTYSRLLKFDARARVGRAKVQNYHGIVYPGLLRAGISCGIGESIRAFVDGVNAGVVSMDYLRYDMLVIDEYQDITTEYAELLELIKAYNPGIHIVMVGDPEQKIQSNTTCDAVAFSREFTSNAAIVPFTQSFRIGPEMAALVSQGWGKQITGVNTAQKVEVMGYEEAVGLIAATKPGDLLCLGARRGAMADALNEVEERMPGVFNKNTVFASVRDSGGGADPSPGVAVFTTFDSSKGMERKRCVIFDFDPALWGLRSSLPNVNKTVLRNIFLVAATRGKDHVVFVDSSLREERQRDSSWLGMDVDQIPGTRMPDDYLGAIPITTFTEVTEGVEDESTQSYHMPFMASQCFDFVYAEDVAHAMSCINRVRLDDGTAPDIEVSNTDGLIDTSAAVGLYQEAVFFPRFDALAEMVTTVSSVARHVERGIRERRKTTTRKDHWRDCLEIAALESNQSRYITQTAQRPTQTQVQAIRDRLGTIVDADREIIQRPLSMALRTRQGDKLVFQGVCDVLRASEVVELKFTSELSYSMFLQTALYVVMSKVEAGLLFNTRTGETWRITVPDRDSFLAAVTTCVTMRHRDFSERMP